MTNKKTQEIKRHHSLIQEAASVLNIDPSLISFLVSKPLSTADILQSNKKKKTGHTSHIAFTSKTYKAIKDIAGLAIPNKRKTEILAWIANRKIVNGRADGSPLSFENDAVRVQINLKNRNFKPASPQIGVGRAENKIFTDLRKQLFENDRLTMVATTTGRWYIFAQEKKALLDATTFLYWDHAEEKGPTFESILKEDLPVHIDETSIQREEKDPSNQTVTLERQKDLSADHNIMCEAISKYIKDTKKGWEVIRELPFKYGEAVFRFDIVAVKKNEKDHGYKIKLFEVKTFDQKNEPALDYLKRGEIYRCLGQLITYRYSLEDASLENDWNLKVEPVAFLKTNNKFGGAEELPRVFESQMIKVIFNDFSKLGALL